MSFASDTIVISPALATRSLAENVQEFWKYRRLVWTMVERDLRVRYKGSVLGVVWSMIVPIMQAFIYTIVFGVILGTGGKNLSAYIFCALVPWLFFQSAIMDASQSILSQLQLIKKVYFPRELPVIAATISSLIHLTISLTVFVVYRFVILSLMWHQWAGPPSTSIVYLPIVLFELFLLTLGISFFVAALNVFYEDIKFVVTIGLQFFMYLTPIMYFAENLRYARKIPQSLHWAAYHFYLGNPIAWIVGSFKQMFFPPAHVPCPGLPHGLQTAPFDPRYCLITLVTSALVCIAGYRTFTKLKWRFTERV